MNTHPAGNRVIVKLLLEQAGAAVDPANVFAEFHSPTGTVTIYQYLVDPELTKAADGDYRALSPVTTEGVWTVVGYSTSPQGESTCLRYRVAASCRA